MWRRERAFSTHPTSDMLPYPNPRFMVVGPIRRVVPKFDCPDCDRGIAMHELETRTVAQRTGFETNYRCPFCGADFEDVAALMA